MSIVKIILYVQWNPLSERKTESLGKYRLPRTTKKSFSNVVMRQAVSAIPFIASLQMPGSNGVILAPTTMLTQQGKRIKTDKRDARLIAQCLCYGGYHPVYIPTGEDDAVKEYLRMRDDHKLALKKLKQQINAFVLRHGQMYTGTK